MRRRASQPSTAITLPAGCASCNSDLVETIEGWLARSLVSGQGDAFIPAEPGDLNAVLEAARRHGVDVLLADLILRHPSASKVSIGFPREALSAVVRFAVARELTVARDVALLLAAANRGGLDLLLLKGTAFAYTYYRQPHLRPRQDVDVFVRTADIGRAEAILLALGFERALEADAELWTSQRHYTKTAAAGAVHVDLHWRVVNPRAFVDVLPFDDVWYRSVAVPALGPIARTLSPPDALMLACVHRVAHHHDRVNLLWLWDIHLVATALTPPEWAQFLALASSSRVLGICRRGLLMAADCFGTSIPESVMAEVQAVEPAAAFLRAGLRQVDIARADLAAMTSWRQKLALVREHLCPPVAYMRARYARCPSVLLPLAYVHRIVRGAPRWFARL
jgi:Uncharacterised nucleotidyltransferase